MLYHDNVKCVVSDVAFQYNFLSALFVCSSCKVILVTKLRDMEVFNNEFACLTHYKTSVKGKVIDYVISFNQKQHDINDIVNQTLSLVEELFQSFKNKRMNA